MKYFIDTNIPMYAAGKPSPYKEPCGKILQRIATGELDAATDVEVFQEILYRYHYIRRADLGHRIFADFKLLVDQVLPVQPADIFLAEELARTLPDVKPRDLLHAAVMHRNGIEKILSVDREFDRIARSATDIATERVDPLDLG